MIYNTEHLHVSEFAYLTSKGIFNQEETDNLEDLSEDSESQVNNLKKVSKKEQRCLGKDS